MSNYVNKIFWGFMPQLNAAEEITLIFAHKINRYNPSFMFFWEGSCKFLFLLLVTWVSVFLYDENYMLVATDNDALAYQEIMIIVMLVASFLYELGDLEGTTIVDSNNFKIKSKTVLAVLKRSFDKYLNLWNALDFISLLLVLIWAILRHFPDQRNNGRAFLALSAIPFSLSMLAYISTFESLGTLVLILIGKIIRLAIFSPLV